MRTHNVSLQEGVGIIDAPVYMRFSSEMDYEVELRQVELLYVADVPLEKCVVGVVEILAEILYVPGVGKFVKIDYLVVGMFL